MNISDDQLQAIVQQVVKRVMDDSPGPATHTPANPQGDWGVFHDMNDAISAAERAFHEYEQFDIQDRKIFTDAIRQMIMDYKEEFSRMAVEQTKMGRVPHKIAKHVNVAKHASGVEFLKPDC